MSKMNAKTDATAIAAIVALENLDGPAIAGGALTLNRKNVISVERNYGREKTLLENAKKRKALVLITPSNEEKYLAECVPCLRYTLLRDEWVSRKSADPPV